MYNSEGIWNIPAKINFAKHIHFPNHIKPIAMYPGYPWWSEAAASKPEHTEACDLGKPSASQDIGKMEAGWRERRNIWTGAVVEKKKGKGTDWATVM
jgi:hypothetical protein